ncbi:MAG: DUF4256 domain-containing protein [Saprospiraceae bacterium]|nr:DUF4256 domain-containing protein [Saprospiraceae bacterium]
MKKIKRELNKKQTQEILSILKTRFEKNTNRHKGVDWPTVLTRLNQHPEKLWSLYEMERTGGEPDVVGTDSKTGECIFFDCSEQSPKGRRSVCYDPEAWLSRKENRPQSSALGMAEEMGIQMLDETQYRHLQTLGAFDTKTSSWLLTPESIRKHGGAIFGDCRYHAVFIYHNGAESYYAARGFRGQLSV